MLNEVDGATPSVVAGVVPPGVGKRLGVANGSGTVTLDGVWRTILGEQANEKRASEPAPTDSGRDSAGEPARARPGVPLSLLLGAAIALGIGAGLVLGENARPLGALGPLIVKLLKTLATPLIFFAVADALLKTEV